MEKESSSKVIIISAASLLVVAACVCWFLFGETKSYEITISDGLSTRSISVDKNNYMTRPSTPVKEGYNFLGWYNGNELFDFENTPITSDIKIVAKWELAGEEIDNGYVVVFNTDGGNKIANVTVESGKTVEKPIDPTKDGYQFVEWLLDGKTYDFNKEVVSNITLIAKWKKTQAVDNETSKKVTKYNVKFDTDGGNAMNSVSIEKGKKVSMPENPIKDGYTFVEWQLDGKKYDFNSAVKSSITLKAIWSKNPVYYTVSYNTNGANAISSESILEGNKVNAPLNPTKDGYTFVEWQLDGKKYDFNSEVRSNITLNAIWSKNPVYYTVTYNTDGASAINSENILEGTKVNEPTTKPIKDGYVFREWQLNGKKYDFNSEVRSNITLKATWNTYTVEIFETDTVGTPLGARVYENGKDITTSVSRLLDSTGTENLGKYQSNIGGIAINKTSYVSKIKIINLNNGNKLYVTNVTQ